MRVHSATRSVWCDVDNTLVIWDWQEVSPDGVGCIDITDPSDKVSVRVYVHNRHVELLKQFKARGHTVWVWSQGGSAWAAAVCTALGLENIVDEVVDKPSWYIDDLPASVWMKAPIYLDPMNPNKDKRWGIVEDYELENEDN